MNLHILITIMIMTPVLSMECPSPCRCSQVGGHNLTVCQDIGLTSIPPLIDTSTNFLDLSANPLGGQLENKTFPDFHLFSLEIIDLANCSIQHLHQAVFSGQRKLKEVDLSDNQIRSLDRMLFVDNKILELVNLSRNPITILNSFQFASMPRLKVLDFQSCHIEQIEQEALSSLPTLESLQLQDNMLTTLPSNLFTWMNKLKRVDLGGNPWRCDCNIQLVTIGLQMRRLYRNWSCQYESSETPVLWKDMDNVSVECAHKFGAFIEETVNSAGGPEKIGGGFNFSVMEVRRRLRYVKEVEKVPIGWLVLIGVVGGCFTLLVVKKARKIQNKGTHSRNYEDNHNELGLVAVKSDVQKNYDGYENPSTSYTNESFSLLDCNSSDDMSVSMGL